jgi:Acetyltransferase (GNAT) domain
MDTGLNLQPFDAKTGLRDQRRLFKDCFPETIGQPAEREEHYLWKFHSFPRRPPSYEYGAYLGEDLIGYYAAIPFSYVVEGRELSAAMVCDVMTGTRARGKGVFTRLGAYSLEQMKSAGLDFTTGYPIRPEVLPGHLKVGWKVVGGMPIYLKVLKSQSILRQKKLGFLSPVANAGAAVFNYCHSLKAAGKEYSLSTLSVEELLRDDSYPPFLRKWMSGIANALRKDRDFLKWRLGAPAAAYYVFVVRIGSGDIAALSIARDTVLEKIPALALLDLMILPGHERAIRALDRAWRDHASRSGSEVIATMMAPQWARRYGLGSMAFLKSPFVFSLIVRKFNPSVDDRLLFDPARWHTMWIDSDDL